MKKQKDTSAENTKVTCKYKNTGTYVMVCEEEKDTAPANETRTIETTEPETVIEQTVEEEIAVPIVGETAEAGAVEPLGESTSWYPDTVNYDNVVNYEYGTSTPYVASLTNPEVGIEPRDILLIAIIAVACLAVVGSITFLTGRALTSRAERKDFTRK